VALLADFGTKKGVPKVPAKMAQMTRHKMAQCLTNYCLLPFRGLLLTIAGFDALAAPPHPAGLRTGGKPSHRRDSEPKAIRL
jgi:hypothetical protein